MFVRVNGVGLILIRSLAQEDLTLPKVFGQVDRLNRNI